ncbi:hypothetical protein AMECASPLE_030670, partial [Ameca splendens]
SSHSYSGRSFAPVCTLSGFLSCASTHSGTPWWSHLRIPSEKSPYCSTGRSFLNLLPGALPDTNHQSPACPPSQQSTAPLPSPLFLLEQVNKHHHNLVHTRNLPTSTVDLLTFSPGPLPSATTSHPGTCSQAWKTHSLCHFNKSFKP